MGVVTRIYKLPVVGYGQVVNVDGNAYIEGNNQDPIRVGNSIDEFLSETGLEVSSPISYKVILYDFKQDYCIVELSAEEEVHAQYNLWLEQKGSPKEKVVIRNDKNLPWDDFILCSPVLDIQLLSQHVTEERLREIRERVETSYGIKFI